MNNKRNERENLPELVKLENQFDSMEKKQKKEAKTLSKLINQFNSMEVGEQTKEEIYFKNLNNYNKDITEKSPPMLSKTTKKNEKYHLKTPDTKSTSFADKLDIKTKKIKNNNIQK